MKEVMDGMDIMDGQMDGGRHGGGTDHWQRVARACMRFPRPCPCPGRPLIRLPACKKRKELVAQNVGRIAEEPRAWYDSKQ